MKRSVLFLFVLVFLMSSCDVSKRITYFQDIQDHQTISGKTEQPTPEIRLRPEDKISIIVNTKVPELTSLFNLPYTARILGQSTDYINNVNQGTSAYIIKADGTIDFPVLGAVQAAGLTRDELSSYIKEELINRNLVNDPVVTVEFVNLQFSVMGEVRVPGSYKITRDHITLLEALSMAGDLNIDGRRDNVLVLRPNATGEITAYSVDMRSFDNVKNSPAYYIHQNDYIYIEPNKKRANQSTVNANTIQSASFWISVVSLLASVATTVSVLMIRWGN
ncbi:MAG: polysaccharide biosynthesis/export family protein [Bacteroidales bacterium]|nr:polysaccharide biosynthesis/export family protein [Bacteroidales bacterium]MBR6929706.1 polysaccharide biosynthesis/export family protein [Bacteroidales bacterium]